MRVLVLADASFALREQAMLARLEVGLTDEGVRVVHAVPDSVTEQHEPGVFRQRLTYQEGTVLTRRLRARRLLQAMLEGTPVQPGMPDVVHAFGRDVWALAAEVARQGESALVLEVDRPAVVPLAARLSAAGAATGLRRGDSTARPGLLLTPDPALERLIVSTGVDAPTRVVPWGVHTPPVAAAILAPGRIRGAVVVGSGHDAAAWMAAMEGLARLMSRVDDLLVFADAEGARRVDLWSRVKSWPIHDRITLAPDVEWRRDLVLHADMLILPEALGEHRSLTLDAMAAGLIVIAAADPYVSVLMDGRTARLVDAPRAERWAAALSWVFDAPDQARTLAGSARQYVQQHHKASTHVAGVMDAYESLLAGRSLPFERLPPQPGSTPGGDFLVP